MLKPKIAIFGASGFVGSALVERIFFDKGYEFKALIHSFGNAARLARLPIQLTPVDILDFNQVNSALQGCNVVVNCSRGGAPTMMKGLRNIVKACKHNKIEKFIHIGSIAIYGQNPPPESSDESASPDPGSDLYGITKLEQDKMILELHASGTPSIILCPSNISGPYSPFVRGAARKIIDNEIMLVDGGMNYTNLIHVDNLVEAILAAVQSDEGWGERYFINEVEKTTWKEFYEELREILNLNIELQSVPRERVLTNLKKGGDKKGFKGSMKILKSREFREAMSVFPAFKKFNAFACNLFYRLHPDFQNKLLHKLTGPMIIKEDSPRINFDDPHIRVQVRQVYHSPQKIISKLKYAPLLDYRQRKKTTGDWFQFINFG